MHNDNIENNVNDELITKIKPKESYYSFCDMCSNCLFMFCLLQ